MCVVAYKTVGFNIALAKSDALGDDDTSKVGSLVSDMTKFEETRLKGVRARLAHASVDLVAISVARFGAARKPSIGSNSRPRQLEFGG
jgi:hypothetical protein